MHAAKRKCFWQTLKAAIYWVFFKSHMRVMVYTLIYAICICMLYSAEGILKGQGEASGTPTAENRRARNAELRAALESERDRANRLEADSKVQLAEANAEIAELAGEPAGLAERQQTIAAMPFWRRGRMAMKLLGPGSDREM